MIVINQLRLRQRNPAGLNLIVLGQIPLVVSVIYVRAWPGQPRRVAFLTQEPHE
jgi:hypothetical protein